MLRCIKALSLKVAPWRRSIRIFTIRRLAGIARIAGAKATSKERLCDCVRCGIFDVWHGSIHGGKSGEVVNI